MGDAAGGADRLDGEALFQAVQARQALPEGLAAAEEDRNEHEVHLVDQVGLEELADGGRAAADRTSRPPAASRPPPGPAPGWRR